MVAMDATPRHLCQRCRDRKVGLRCFECCRSERERLRAQGLRDAAPASSGPFAAANRPPLTTAQRKHRRVMLEHLQRRSSAVS